MDNKENVKTNELGVVSPWVELYRKIEAMFKYDDEIHVEYSNEAREVTLFISSLDKYEALARLIPSEVAFGNVVLKIDLMPANFDSLPAVDLFRKAFKGNPAVTDIISIHREELETSNDFNYIVCKKEVVQYHNDTLNDPHGNCSTLYQDIARDIFIEQGGIYFCTGRE